MFYKELLVLSTAHLTDDTNAFLACTDCMEWPVLGGPYGGIGWAMEVDEGVANDTQRPVFQDIFAALRYAADNHYSRVLFYDLGEVINDLPTYRDPNEEEENPNLYQGSSEWFAARDRQHASARNSSAIRAATDRLVELRGTLSTIHHDFLADCGPVSRERANEMEKQSWIKEASWVRKQLLALNTLITDLHFGV